MVALSAMIPEAIKENRIVGHPDLDSYLKIRKLIDSILVDKREGLSKERVKPGG